MPTTPDSAAPQAPATATAPAPVSQTALRLTALGGLALLLLSLIATCVIILEDSIGGDGVAGSASTTAIWALGFGGVLGLLAAAVPRDALDIGPRAKVVLIQYVLAFVAPVVALLD